MYPPSSGRHAMRCLYVIGRDSWVRDMSNTQWLEMDSSHGVGECSVSVVCPLAGVYSDRPPSEVIVVVVVAVVVVGVVIAVVHVVAVGTVVVVEVVLLVVFVIGHGQSLWMLLLLL